MVVILLEARHCIPWVGNLQSADQMQLAWMFNMACISVFFKVFWGTKTVSQIPPTVSQNIVTWGHINGERSLKFLQVVS